jgi:hypothetical protein
VDRGPRGRGGAAYVGGADARSLIPEQGLGLVGLDTLQRCAHDPALQPWRFRDGRVEDVRPCATSECLARWVAGLPRWHTLGPVAWWVPVRAASAAARVALARWERDEETCCCGSSARGHSWGDGHTFTHACAYYTQDQPEGISPCECASPNPRRAVDAVDAWLACPCTAHWNAKHVAYVEAGHLEWLPAPAAERAIESIQPAADLAGEARVRDAIRTALTTWALGDHRG